MNIELLNAVREDILKNAARFNMKYLGVKCSPNIDEISETPPCNTQACVAGETLLHVGKARINPSGGLDYIHDSLGFDVEEEAGRALDLTFEQRERLFSFQSWRGGRALGWPPSFEKEYNAATTPTARAEVASRRILHFIATDGRE